MAYSDGQCLKQESWKQGEVKIAQKAQSRHFELVWASIKITLKKIVVY